MARLAAQWPKVEPSAPRSSGSYDVHETSLKGDRILELEPYPNYVSYLDTVQHSRVKIV